MSPEENPDVKRISAQIEPLKPLLPYEEIKIEETNEEDVVPDDEFEIYNIDQVPDFNSKSQSVELLSLSDHE
jgi:hypothetical protein